ncbi:PDZ domain-containing protein [Allosaccharopolyspora coralli]|uniref:PDZ domain-containing protein n=1 Tax=Allosaccharopolyspora coralli TaxID=2665642 RepID=A0A5Q3QAK9_9PSEU|nr:trypsin-like peptidase domain-containing protein [Allosaccharopolyspora coralli]QGK68649.1 PDZ domain-containing protein [Allosaccharopolyspora coralli]
MADNDPRPNGAGDETAAGGPQPHGSPEQAGAAPEHTTRPQQSGTPEGLGTPPAGAGHYGENPPTAQFQPYPGSGSPNDPGQQGRYGQSQYPPGAYSQGHYGQGEQDASQQHGYYPMSPVHQPENQGKRRGGGGKLVAGAVGLALVLGLLAGGAGGLVGYRMGAENTPGSTSLNTPSPARSINNAPQGSVQAVADKVLPSVVQLQVNSAQGSGEGSGVVISEDGYILTNNHVAEGAERGQMTALFHDNRSAPVRVVGKDPRSDLAVVKADITGLQPAEFGSSGDLPVGSDVVAIGSPFGLSGTVTSGIVSAKDRPVRAGGESGQQSSVLNALQTDAAINPGNSGGPLVDMEGRVVGINSAIYSPGSGQQQAGSVGLGFAIPSDQARRIADELLRTGSATHTTLGVQITDARRAGALVAEVVPGSPAERAGLRQGEVVTKMDDRAIRDADTLVAAVSAETPGAQVTLTVAGEGGGGERTVDVTLSGQK